MAEAVLLAGRLQTCPGSPRCRQAEQPQLGPGGGGGESGHRAGNCDRRQGLTLSGVKPSLDAGYVIS